MREPRVTPASSANAFTQTTRKGRPDDEDGEDCASVAYGPARGLRGGSGRDGGPAEGDEVHGEALREAGGGKAGPVAIALCTPCKSPARGTVTGEPAAAVVT